MTDTRQVLGATRAAEQALLALARLPHDAPLQLVWSLACESAAEVLGVDRVGVWLFIDDRTALRCAALYERSRGAFSSGATLLVADFPVYFASLTSRKSLPIELAADDPRTAELAEVYLAPLGIGSMLDAGIFLDGELVGVVCHEHVGPPREWTTEARDFASSVADLLALRVQSAKVAELKEVFRTQKDRLATMQKAQALEQVAGGLAHDFTNILSVISGKAELLARQQDLPEDARRQARDVVAFAERGHALLRQLLDFSRPSGRPPAVLDLAEATAAFLPLLQAAAGRKHEVCFDRPASLGPVLMDKTQYTRVLLNLTLNARDAMPGGGRVVLRLRPVSPATGDAGRAHHVLLEVIDEGEGMDAATLAQAPEPFFTTKAEGTGLGLAVVHRLVDQAGGTVHIHSERGRGTTVAVYLPRVGVGSFNPGGA